MPLFNYKCLTLILVSRQAQQQRRLSRTHAIQSKACDDGWNVVIIVVVVDVLWPSALLGAKLQLAFLLPKFGRLSLTLAFLGLGPQSGTKRSEFLTRGRLTFRPQGNLVRIPAVVRTSRPPSRRHRVRRRRRMSRARARRRTARRPTPAPVSGRPRRRPGPKGSDRILLSQLLLVGRKTELDRPSTQTRTRRSGGALEIHAQGAERRCALKQLI